MCFGLFAGLIRFCLGLLCVGFVVWFCFADCMLIDGFGGYCLVWVLVFMFAIAGLVVCCVLCCYFVVWIFLMV